MIVFRPVESQDLSAIEALVHTSGSGIGITTLPKDPALLAERIHLSCESFKTNDFTQAHYYWFILEDTKTSACIGVSAIATGLGYTHPFYTYKRVNYSRMSPSLGIRHHDELLELSNDFEGCSELCTLFLNPEYRHQGMGAFLSRTRLCFIAQFKERFSPTLIAEMRGVSTAKGSSAFWNAVGKHFFHLSFEKADALTLTQNKQFIADLMPQHPLYVSLLPKSAQAVIGKPHPLTQRAMQILLNEGFEHHGYIDIFDAGPVLEASLTHLHTLKQSRCLPAQVTQDNSLRTQAIVTNTQLTFRATKTQVNITPNTLCLSEKDAQLLEIKPGDAVRFIAEPPHD